MKNSTEVGLTNDRSRAVFLFAPRSLPFPGPDSWSRMLSRLFHIFGTLVPLVRLLSRKCCRQNAGPPCKQLRSAWA